MKALPTPAPGTVFGYLTFISVAPEPTCYGRRAWRLLCKCGNETTANAGYVRSGHTKSCGCMKGWAKGEGRKHGMARRGGEAPEYRVWTLMRSRCNRPNDARFARYGGRGIRVCERWGDFAEFLADMGPRPSLKHSLDRINNDGNYCPENCRWATDTQQQQNKSNNRILEFDGKRLPQSEWGRITGLGGNLLSYRLKMGWTVREALTTPARPLRKAHLDSIRPL